MSYVSKIGTHDNPCTATNSADAERGGLYCKCSKCGTIKRCTPRFDFYRSARYPDQLWCDACANHGSALP